MTERQADLRRLQDAALNECCASVWTLMLAGLFGRRSTLAFNGTLYVLRTYRGTPYLMHSARADWP